MENTGNLMTAFPHGKTRPYREYFFLTDEELTEFTATAVSLGTAAISDTVPGGALAVSGAATTDDSGSNIQLDAAPVLLTSGQNARLLIELQINDVVESDLMVGFGVVDTSVIAGISDFVGFRKVDGSAALQGYFIRDTGTAQTVALGTLVNDTKVILALETSVGPSGAGRTVFYVNGSAAGYLDHTVNHLSENQSTPTIAFQSGNNVGTKTLLVHKLGFDWG